MQTVDVLMLLAMDTLYAVRCVFDYQTQFHAVTALINFLQYGVSSASCLFLCSVTVLLRRISDNMPVAWCYEVQGEQQPYCATGFPIGCFANAKGEPQDACIAFNNMNEKSATYIFNHIDFLIEYHTPKVGSGMHRIVAVNVSPRSIKHPDGDKKVKCEATAPPLRVFTGTGPNAPAKQSIKYSYAVKFLVRYVCHCASMTVSLLFLLSLSSHWEALHVQLTTIGFLVSSYSGFVFCA